MKRVPVMKSLRFWIPLISALIFLILYIWASPFNRADHRLTRLQPVLVGCTIIGDFY
jgi:hypothetical protein